MLCVSPVVVETRSEFTNKHSWDDPRRWNTRFLLVPVGGYQLQHELVILDGISPSLRFCLPSSISYIARLIFYILMRRHGRKKTSIEPRIDVKNLSLFFRWRFHEVQDSCILIPETSHDNRLFLYKVLSDKLALHTGRYRWYVTKQFASDPLLMNEAKIFRCSLRVFRRMREFGYGFYLWWISAARNDRRLRSAIPFLAVHLYYFESCEEQLSVGRVFSIWPHFCDHFEIKLVGGERVSKLNFENNIKLDPLEGSMNLDSNYRRKLLLDSSWVLSLTIQNSRIQSVNCPFNSILKSSTTISHSWKFDLKILGPVFPHI